MLSLLLSPLVALQPPYMTPPSAQAQRFEVELESEREHREDASAAVMKLQDVILSVKYEMEQAACAADNARKELGKEKAARAEAEEAVELLRGQLTTMQEDGERRFEEAAKAMQRFRAEMENMKKRSKQAWDSVQEKQANMDKVCKGGLKGAGAKGAAVRHVGRGHRGTLKKQRMVSNRKGVGWILGIVPSSPPLSHLPPARLHSVEHFPPTSLLALLFLGPPPCENYMMSLGG